MSSIDSFIDSSSQVFGLTGQSLLSSQVFSMVEHRNTTATVRLVMKACEASGIDIDELLDASNIDRKVAEDADGEVNVIQMKAFWEHAYHLSGDPYLGMHAAEYLEVGTYKCLDYLTIYAKTIGESLANYGKYIDLINTWLGMEFFEDNDCIRIRLTSDLGVIPPQSFEFVYAMLTLRLRLVANPDWAAHSISFPFEEPPDPEKHREFFQTDITYNATVGEFVVSSADWNRQLLNSDDQLMKVLDEHARLLLSNRVLPDDFIGQVRQEIVRDLHGGSAQRDIIAKRLNMSPRTLQRRLDENGISYADLLDDVRQTLAKDKLHDGDLSIGEIGFLLGFSEQSSFSRAFKRWTNQSPADYRSSLQNH